MKLVFASSNKNKIKEIKKLLPSTIEILSLEDINCNEEIEETEDTIEGNAILKANYIAKKYNLPCFADDSGLEVEVLNGAPGVFSARYAGNEKNDLLNMDKLLFEMKDKTNRNAKFKTVIALNINGMQKIFTGIIKGKINEHKKGENGFGYDPLFVPENHDKTFAELTLDEKIKLSHRSIALNKLLSFLTTLP